MFFYTRYRRELGAARRRVQLSGSSITETTLGAIEQVTFGEGPPVLLVHGVVGGADQGLGLAGAYFGDGFKVVAVSRFGYVRSPLHIDSSPRAQADRYAALLDAIGIGKVAVVGTSAGTASCLQFALRHADRCSALVLFSMAVPPYPIPPTPVRRLVRASCRSEFLFWMMFQFPSVRNRLLGEPSNIVKHARAADREMVTQLTESFLPGSLRADGIINDMAVSNPDLNRGYPFEEIAIPALIFHAKDDRWGAFAKAKEAADRIPGVHFRAIESGGHLLLGSREAVGAEIARSYASTHGPRRLQDLSPPHAAIAVARKGDEVPVLVEPKTYCGGDFWSLVRRGIATMYPREARELLDALRSCGLRRSSLSTRSTNAQPSIWESSCAACRRLPRTSTRAQYSRPRRRSLYPTI